MNIANEINGDFYVAGQSGEVEEDLVNRRVYIPENDVRTFGLGVVPDRTQPPVRAAILRVVRLNFWMHWINTGQEVAKIDNSIKVAWIRCLALCMGLLDTARDVAGHHVRYSEVIIYPDADRQNIPAVAPVAAVPNADLKNVDVPVANWTNSLNWRTAVMKKMTNMICMVAYFMRIRGHHYLPDMQERYEQVWRRCLYQEDNPGLDWELIAHDALHAIYPDTLDQFWGDSVEGQTCAGTLTLRYTSYAAGTAALGAVYSGLEDMRLVFPRVIELVPDAVEEIIRCNRVLANERWAGSVNRRFYNAQDLGINERVLSSVAATIIGALNSLASSSPLKDSKALKRVAGNAPITGATIAAMMTKAATHDKMVEAILPVSRAPQPP